jgi:4-coumarate--CoA ligase
VLTYHRVLIANASLDSCSTKENIGLDPGTDVLIAILPFFHIYGQVVALLTGLSCGGKVVSLPKFEAELYLNTVQTHRVSVPVH